jgi:hypothetical protein
MDTTIAIVIPAACIALGLSLWGRINRGRSALACLLCVAAFQLPARADEQKEEFLQLLSQYQAARKIVAESPEGDREARSNAREAAHALLPKLLDIWMALPDGSEERPTIGELIKVICRDMASPPRTERENDEKSFIARTVWPLLADEKVTQEQAAFLAELSKPQFSIRMNDRIARLGMGTEPLGWDVQAAYALALVRSGNPKQARDEITILHKKVSKNHKVRPEDQSFTDALQLCEVLHALQAAVSKDHEGAMKHIENARKLQDAISPKAAPLVDEVTRRVLEAERDAKEQAPENARSVIDT